MPKKERIYVTPPVESEPMEELSQPEVEAPTVVPAAEAPVEVPVPVVSCENCGLPRSEFARRWAGLRVDLQTKNGRKLCPVCFKPVEPY